MDVSVQLNELEDYMKLNKHTNAVLDNFKNLDNINENDIYDIIYVKQLIRERLDRSIDNDDVRESLNDTLNRIELIVKLLTPDIIEKARNKEKTKQDKEKIKHVEKQKYEGNRPTGGLFNLMSARRKEQLESTSLQEYLKRKGLMTVILIGMFGFGMTHLMDLIVAVTQSAAATVTGTEVTSELQSMQGQFVGVIRQLMSILSTLITVVLTVGFVMDIMYIMFPSMQSLKGKDDVSFVSSAAREAIELGEKTKEVFQVDKENNKVGLERAQIIYGNFVDSEKKLAKLTKKDRKDTNEDERESILVNKVYCSVKDFKKHKNKEYIKTLEDVANAEILYNTYPDKYSGLFNERLEEKRKELLSS